MSAGACPLPAGSQAAAREAWLARNLAAAPPLTPEDIAFLRPIFAPAIAALRANATAPAETGAACTAQTAITTSPEGHSR